MSNKELTPQQKTETRLVTTMMALFALQRGLVESLIKNETGNSKISYRVRLDVIDIMFADVLDGLSNNNIIQVIPDDVFEVEANIVSEAAVTEYFSKTNEMLKQLGVPDKLLYNTEKIVSELKRQNNGNTEK